MIFTSAVDSARPSASAYPTLNSYLSFDFLSLRRKKNLIFESLPPPSKHFPTPRGLYEPTLNYCLHLIKLSEATEFDALPDSVSNFEHLRSNVVEAQMGVGGRSGGKWNGIDDVQQWRYILRLVEPKLNLKLHNMIQSRFNRCSDD